MKFKNLKNIFLILIIILFQSIISLSETRDVPNIIIKDNPKKEVYQIDTIKRRTKPAELNLTVTKVKTEELPVKIDKKRNIIFVDLKDISEKNIYPLESLKNLPNPETASGRRAINRIKMKKTEGNLSVKRYEINSKEKKIRLEINYKTLPKNIFLVITDKDSFKPNKIYRAKFSDYISPRGNNVSIKLWIFGEELGSFTNLVINPNKNNNGNIEVRKNGEYIYPEDAIEQIGLRTVFDMTGEPEAFEFEESDKIEIKNVGGAGSTAVSNIKNNQGSFYKERNEYAECTIPGYYLKTRIWSDSKKIEFSLTKTSKIDGYVNFKIIHIASDGTVRQEINVEMYINNKSFDRYFSGLTAYSNVENFRYMSPEYDYSINKYVYPISINEGISVTNFISDRINYITVIPTSSSPIKVKKTWGEKTGEQILDGYTKVQSNSSGFNVNSSDNKINAYVTSSKVEVEENWLNPISNTTQYFEFNGSYLSYGKDKRKIELKNVAGLTDGYFSNFGVSMIGTIIGLPIKSEILDTTLKNGKDIVVKFDEGDSFYISKKSTGSSFYCLLNGNYATESNLKYDGAKFITKYNTSRDGFKYYNLLLEKLELKNRERVYKIEGRDGIYFNKNIITIPTFDSEILINKTISSLEKNIIKYIDVSDRFDTSFVRPIELGEIYFNKYDDIGILRDNGLNPPYIDLPKSVYLEDESDTSSRIKVNLSFNQNIIKSILEMDNYNNSSAYGGGNGAKVYLLISPEEYKKMVEKGGGKKYILKGGEIKVGFNIDKALLSGNPAGKIEKTLVSKVEIYTRIVNPSVVKIKFNENTPLLKNCFFSLLNTTLDYLTQPSDAYNYNRTINLLGSVAQYNYTEKKHNYELMDDNGKIIDGFISSNGNGGYWENVDVGDGNKITLSQGKDIKTYIALTNWNYESSQGSISIKHYIKSTPETNQYYKFYFSIPQLDPYTYYNEQYNGQTIKKGENIEKVLKESENEIELGYISLENYNMDITIKNSGSKFDLEGMRIEKQIRDLDIIDLQTGISTGKKAKIKLVDDSGNEITENKIIGSNKHAKIILEIPSDLSRTSEYEIKSEVGADILFNNSQDNYILKIGRNGYWKELINKVILKGIKKLEGSATLKVSGLYEENKAIIFENIDYNNLNIPQLKDPVPIGITLEDKVGYGILKGQKDDRAYIKYNGHIIEIGKLDSLGTTNVKNIILDNGNEIEVQYKNGEFVINLTKIKLGAQTDEVISICLDRGNDQVLEFNLKLLIEKSWFKIVDKGVLDFGEVIAGRKNLEAKSSVILEASSSIIFNNVKVILNNSKVPLYPVSTPSMKDLEANIIFYELKKESTQNMYKLDVESKLDTTDTSKLGEQKGIVEFIIEIRE